MAKPKSGEGRPRQAKKRGSAPATPAELTFHYLKSNYFRVVHSDGVYGGLTPTGDVMMTFWSQRNAIPKEVTHALTADGSVGEELRREGKSGIVREAEVSVVFSIQVAQELATWLQDKIVKHGEITEQLHESKSSGTKPTEQAN
jgi:hypothetical protein